MDRTSVRVKVRAAVRVSVRLRVQISTSLRRLLDENKKSFL